MNERAGKVRKYACAGQLVVADSADEAWLWTTLRLQQEQRLSVETAFTAFTAFTALMLSAGRNQGSPSFRGCWCVHLQAASSSASPGGELSSWLQDASLGVSNWLPDHARSPKLGCWLVPLFHANLHRPPAVSFPDIHKPTLAPSLLPRPTSCNPLSPF